MNNFSPIGKYSKHSYRNFPIDRPKINTSVMSFLKREAGSLDVLRNQSQNSSMIEKGIKAELEIETS
jgi:hypothetical protein